MEKAEVFKRMMEDKRIEDVIRVISELKGEYGENGDDLLGYLIGAMSNLYDDETEAVYAYETMKTALILRDLGLSGDFVAKVQREKEPHVLKPA